MHTLQRPPTVDNEITHIDVRYLLFFSDFFSRCADSVDIEPKSVDQYIITIANK